MDQSAPFVAEQPLGALPQTPVATRQTNDASIQITMTSADLVWVIFILSLVEITASAYLCDNKATILGRIPSNLQCTNQLAWALACGTTSASICFVYMLLVRCAGFQPESLNWYCSTLLFLLWLPGVAVLTFDQPYEVTGNGYFATWACFLCTCWFYYNSSVGMKGFMGVLLSAGTDQKKQAIMLLLFSSYIELIQACVVCTRQSCNTRQSLAIIAGSVSIFLGTIMMVVSNANALSRLVAFFFVCWWGFMSFILTFQTPFQHTGNGYFACWICFYASWRYMAYHLTPANAAPSVLSNAGQDSQYSSAAI